MGEWFDDPLFAAALRLYTRLLPGARMAIIKNQRVTTSGAIGSNWARNGKIDGVVAMFASIRLWCNIRKQNRLSWGPQPRLTPSRRHPRNAAKTPASRRLVNRTRRGQRFNLDRNHV